LINEMNITHHGRSEAVIRALTDFGSEESFEHAAKRFAEHEKYALPSSTVSRVTKQIAAEACASVEQTLSHAAPDEGEGDASKKPEGVTPMLVEVDGCEIRTGVLGPAEQAQDRTPVRQAPKRQKQINWRDVRIGFARPLDSMSKWYVGKHDTSPEVVRDRVQAAA